MCRSRSVPQTCIVFLLGLLSWLLITGAVVSAERKPAEDAPLWNAAWITDTQTPQCEWITTLVSRVAANRPKMVLHTGDTRFEWANRCAWRGVMSLIVKETPPIEFHLAPGNHDLQNGVLHRHLRRAATQGIYRLDTGIKAAGQGYYHNRVTEDAWGVLWPVWNSEVAGHPAWQSSANKRPPRHTHPELPYRYVFHRGAIRFIVCDCYYTDQQRDWVRELITKPDDSSVSILLQHKHEVDDLAKYFEGLEGKHNVKLVLTGDHHNYCFEQRHGVTFITAAGMARGEEGDSDAMTLWVYKDRLRLDRYVIPKGNAMNPIKGPEAIWACPGRFSEYRRPTPEAGPAASRSGGSPPPSLPVGGGLAFNSRSRTIGPNLLLNGNFDNFIWYDRYRGWSPTGWYQWFTRGGHAPEHAVGTRLPHSGKEYVRIHMWAYAWRGGILQNVRGVQPCHMYRLTAHGFFQPEEAPGPNARIGIDPRGT
ncbi:MAG: metallophosphoesterase family protein, partial [Planctomycetota bacterium]